MLPKDAQWLPLPPLPAFQSSALPLLSTAIQNDLVGQETEVRGMGVPEVLVSILDQVVHVDPPQESALP